MFKENPFDPVFDCQQVFKTLMNALARPGTIVSMEKNVEKLEMCIRDRCEMQRDRA